jgi:hypothetical protein
MVSLCRERHSVWRPSSLPVEQESVSSTERSFFGEGSGTCSLERIDQIGRRGLGWSAVGCTKFRRRNIPSSLWDSKHATIIHVRDLLTF